MTYFDEVSNNSMESILRSRAMMISGRLLSKEIVYSFLDEPCECYTFIPGDVFFSTNIYWKMLKI